MYVKDRLRRSMMFVPGNNPGMIRDAHIYGADSIMFDLEDSVAYTEKDTARFLVYNALKTLHFGSKETVVRINDLSSGLGIKDLEAVVGPGSGGAPAQNRQRPGRYRLRAGDPAHRAGVRDPRGHHRHDGRH